MWGASYIIPTALIGLIALYQTTKNVVRRRTNPSANTLPNDDNNNNSSNNSNLNTTASTLLPNDSHMNNTNVTNFENNNNNNNNIDDSQLRHSEDTSSDCAEDSPTSSSTSNASISFFPSQSLSQFYNSFDSKDQELLDFYNEENCELETESTLLPLRNNNSSDEDDDNDDIDMDMDMDIDEIETGLTEMNHAQDRTPILSYLQLLNIETSGTPLLFPLTNTAANVSALVAAPFTFTSSPAVSINTPTNNLFDVLNDTYEGLEGSESSESSAGGASNNKNAATILELDDSTLETLKNSLLETDRNLFSTSGTVEATPTSLLDEILQYHPTSATTLTSSSSSSFSSSSNSNLATSALIYNSTAATETSALPKTIKMLEAIEADTSSYSNGKNLLFSETFETFCATSFTDADSSSSSSSSTSSSSSSSNSFLMSKEAIIDEQVSALPSMSMKRKLSPSTTPIPSRTSSKIFFESNNENENNENDENNGGQQNESTQLDMLNSFMDSLYSEDALFANLIEQQQQQQQQQETKNDDSIQQQLQQQQQQQQQETKNDDSIQQQLQQLQQLQQPFFFSDFGNTNTNTATSDENAVINITTPTEEQINTEIDNGAGVGDVAPTPISELCQSPLPRTTATTATTLRAKKRKTTSPQNLSATPSSSSSSSSSSSLSPLSSSSPFNSALLTHGKKSKTEKKNKNVDNDVEDSDVDSDAKIDPSAERKERNRLAAVKCRNRHKQEVSQLQEREQKLENENEKLKLEKVRLMEQVARLKSVLTQHHCTISHGRGISQEELKELEKEVEFSREETMYIVNESLPRSAVATVLRSSLLNKLKMRREKKQE